MKILIPILISLAIISPLEATSIPDSNENNVVIIDETVDLADFFESANAFLIKYVSNGLVDYNAIKTDDISIKKLYATIGAIDLTGVDKNTKTAFYLNAYNLIVIHSVVSKMPIAKPTDVKGFFDITKHNIAGSILTLNEIENNKLRPDPRIHFALVCAAKGCPKLTSTAFTPENVEARLTALTKNALNDNTFIKVDQANKKVQISKIFDWYGVDFIQHSGSPIAYINSIRNEQIPITYKVEFYEYNWNLNSK